jgi:hypothetical protein
MVVGLVFTLGATWWAATTDDSTAGKGAPARRAARGQAVTAAAPASGSRATAAADTAPAELPVVTPQSIVRTALNETPAPQVTLAWGPPPPPPPPPLPKGYKPPPPPPPPLPFQAIGKLEDQGSITAFLLASDGTYAAKQGDTINNNYRVEEVTPQKIVFTFLPLKVRQELSLDAH